MARIHYRIVAHDGGWAYMLNNVFSEPFPSKSAALAAAKRVAAEQHVPGDTTHIEFQDDTGIWHSELSEGDVDRTPMWLPSDVRATDEPRLLASSYISALFRASAPGRSQRFWR